MQFPSTVNPGIPQDNPLYDLESDEITYDDKSLTLPNEYICMEEIPFKTNTPLFAPVCLINFEYQVKSLNFLELGKMEEMAW